jgi:hypothetical protein
MSATGWSIQWSSSSCDPPRSVYDATRLAVAEALGG